MNSGTMRHPRGLAAFRSIRSRILVLAEPDLDTDQIIPARFLTTTSRKGLGRFAFADWRLDPDGERRADCALNDHGAADCRILVTGPNFGCGSSREHAAWALRDLGIRAVVSTRLADIFQSNALRNGILPVLVTPDVHERLVRSPWSEVEIDLERRTIELEDGRESSFPIDPFARHLLLEGIDELDELLAHRTRIEQYEHRRDPDVGGVA